MKIRLHVVLIWLLANQSGGTFAQQPYQPIPYGQAPPQAPSQGGHFQQQQAVAPGQNPQQSRPVAPSQPPVPALSGYNSQQPAQPGVQGHPHQAIPGHHQLPAPAGHNPQQPQPAGHHPQQAIPGHQQPPPVGHPQQVLQSQSKPVPSAHHFPLAPLHGAQTQGQPPPIPLQAQPKPPQTPVQLPQSKPLAAPVQNAPQPKPPPVQVQSSNPAKPRPPPVQDISRPNPPPAPAQSQPKGSHKQAESRPVQSNRQEPQENRPFEYDVPKNTNLKPIPFKVEDAPQEVHWWDAFTKPKAAQPMDEEVIREKIHKVLEESVKAHPHIEPVAPPPPPAKPTTTKKVITKSPSVKTTKKAVTKSPSVKPTTKTKKVVTSNKTSSPSAKPTKLALKKRTNVTRKASSEPRKTTRRITKPSQASTRKVEVKTENLSPDEEADKFPEDPLPLLAVKKEVKKVPTTTSTEMVPEAPMNNIITNVESPQVPLPQPNMNPYYVPLQVPQPQPHMNPYYVPLQVPQPQFVVPPMNGLGGFPENNVPSASKEFYSHEMEQIGNKLGGLSEDEKSHLENVNMEATNLIANQNELFQPPPPQGGGSPQWNAFGAEQGHYPGLQNNRYDFGGMQQFPYNQNPYEVQPLNTLDSQQTVYETEGQGQGPNYDEAYHNPAAAPRTFPPYRFKEPSFDNTIIGSNVNPYDETSKGDGEDTGNFFQRLFGTQSSSSASRRGVDIHWLVCWLTLMISTTYCIS